MSVEDEIGWWTIPKDTELYRGMQIPKSYWGLQDETVAYARRLAHENPVQEKNPLPLLQALINTLIVAAGTKYDISLERQIDELIARIPKNINPTFLTIILDSITSTNPYGPEMAKIFKEKVTK